MEDVRRILSQEDFNKLCDLQISRFISKNPAYHSCFSPNCEQIFLSSETKENDGTFECELCGKWYCMKCKQSHKGYTCEDWKFKLDDKALLALGIKKCPKCGIGIQKNEGCQHMECQNCHAHICWKCLKYFRKSDECYNHLAKECGGIFGRN